jgi:hypothetical protein
MADTILGFNQLCIYQTSDTGIDNQIPLLFVFEEICMYVCLWMQRLTSGLGRELGNQSERKEAIPYLYNIVPFGIHWKLYHLYALLI